MPKRTLRPALGALLLASAFACNPSHILGSDALGPNQADPKATQNAAGAVEAYNGTRAAMQLMFAGSSNEGAFVVTTGLLSDELESGSIGAPRGLFAAGMYTDSRLLAEYRDPSLEPAGEPYILAYLSLHTVRAQAHQAIGLLQQYKPKAPALVGHLHALEGYAEVMLADLYCSGIPLSTLDYGGDFTLEPGSSTAAVYDHALAQFDTAITLAKDSVRILHLAQVGKGRALLALGQFAQAAAAVNPVPDGFQYAEDYQAAVSSGVNSNFGWFDSFASGDTFYSVADREGGTGLDYISSNDPRTATTTVEFNQYQRPDVFAQKYATDGSTPVVLADWIEARLIEAEGSLQAGDVAGWLRTINHLRETAITPALADTTDPGSPAARVDLQFRERAFWLFLTGHRLGDMRRLVRQYQRLPTAVFPFGPYAGGAGAYGTAMNAPVPAEEFVGNAKFTGCINRGA